MALSPPMTLSQVRDEVFTRCTLNQGGDRGSRALKLVDSCIKRAQKELELKAPWLRLSATRTVTLSEGVVVYDFPDDMDPGRTLDVFVRNVSSGKYARLIAEPNQSQKNAATTATNNQPFFYWYENEQLNLTPPPAVATWDSLKLEGYLRASLLTNDEDLLSVDGEAVIQRAEIFARPRLGLQVTKDMVESHQAYVRDTAAHQTEAGSVVMGGDTSQRCAPQDGGSPRNMYAYDESWQPPGFPSLY